MIFSIQNAETARAEFNENGLVVFRDFLTHDYLHLYRERLATLSGEATRKDFLMPQSQNTPRKMTVISGHSMSKCEAIMDLYNNNIMGKILSYITGKSIADCPNDIEKVIATILHADGDTHGWHLDDYPIALIMCLNAPPAGCGGFVELERPQGNEAIYLNDGDSYLLRSDKIRHRVAPLNGNARRIILNFTYSFAGKIVTPNGSANNLFI